MDDNIYNSTRIYTDIQSVQQLKYSKNDDAAKKEVSQQFEAMFMQMLMRSMRDATKAVSSGLFSNNQLDMYEDLFDKQLSLVMSHQPLGFDNIFEKNIDQMLKKNAQPQALHPINAPQVVVHPTHSSAPVAAPTIDKTKNTTDNDNGIFSSKETFINTLWDGAKIAASAIGVMPEVLLAQAALETNWGKNILRQTQGDSSHNLFNMKADADWNKKTTTVASLEYKDGELVKEKSTFKHYGSYLESFMDYMRLLTQSGRYQEAVKKASDPNTFIHAVHKAGFATDPEYAEKVMALFTSPAFNRLISSVKKI